MNTNPEPGTRNMEPSRPYRIGQIVPSSNTTMETEIPAILRGREAVEQERFTFHSSRMRMKKVTKEELADIIKDYVESSYRYVAEGTIKKLLNGQLAALAAENPTLTRALMARLDDMAGRPGPLSKLTNDYLDKAFGLEIAQDLPDNCSADA